MPTTFLYNRHHNTNREDTDFVTSTSTNPNTQTDGFCCSFTKRPLLHLASSKTSLPRLLKDRLRQHKPSYIKQGHIKLLLQADWEKAKARVVFVMYLLYGFNECSTVFAESHKIMKMGNFGGALAFQRVERRLSLTARAFRSYQISLRTGFILSLSVEEPCSGRAVSFVRAPSVPHCCLPSFSQIINKLVILTVVVWWAEISTGRVT